MTTSHSTADYWDNLSDEDFRVLAEAAASQFSSGWFQVKYHPSMGEAAMQLMKFIHQTDDEGRP